MGRDLERQPDDWADTHPYLVVLGWKQHPNTQELYAKFDELGAEVLFEREAFIGGVVGRRGGWWRIPLIRRLLAWRRRKPRPL